MATVHHTHVAVAPQGSVTPSDANLAASSAGTGGIVGRNAAGNAAGAGNSGDTYGGSTSNSGGGRGASSASPD